MKTDWIKDGAMPATARLDEANPFMVGMRKYTRLQDAVNAAAARSTQEESAFTAQITQTLQKGFCGYQGSSAVVAQFRNGRDINEDAADEDGVADLDVRAKAFRPTPESP